MRPEIAQAVQQIIDQDDFPGKLGGRLYDIMQAANEEDMEEIDALRQEITPLLADYVLDSYNSGHITAAQRDILMQKWTKLTQQVPV